jgi:hypothetical protein
MSAARTWDIARKVLCLAGGHLAALIFVLASVVDTAKSLGLIVPASSRDLRVRGVTTFYRSRPLTGVVYAFHGAMRPAMISAFVDGKAHGTEIFWHPNGRREMERRFARGVPHGVHQSWYETGRIKTYRRYVHGLADGEQWAWYEDGQVAEYNRYDRGREITHKTWTFDGKPFHNYVYRDGEKIGIQGEDFCKLRRRSKL